MLRKREDMVNPAIDYDTSNAINIIAIALLVTSISIIIIPIQNSFAQNISAPAVSTWGTGHLNVFVVAPDHTLRYNPYFNGRFAGWQQSLGHPPGVNLTSDPAAVSWDPNRIDVFVRGSDDNIWWISYDRNTNTWNNWQSIGKPNGDGILPTSLKRLGFENGVGPPNGAWEWNSAQYAAPDRLTAVTSPIKEGSHALKATVKHGDNASGGARAEVVLNNVANYFHEGDNAWYHWYTMFPNGSQPTPPWQVWTQWHQGDDRLTGGPAIEFNVHTGTKLDLRVMPWFWDNQSCFTVAAGQCGYQWVEPIRTGVWYEMLFHVKWSQNSNVGSVELWVNGNKVVPCSGCSTHMATLDTRDPTASVYLKQGLYLKDVISQPQYVLHDGMRVAKCPPDHQYYHPNTEKCYTSPPTVFAFSSKR